MDFQKGHQREPYVLSFKSQEQNIRILIWSGYFL